MPVEIFLFLPSLKPDGSTQHVFVRMRSPCTKPERSSPPVLLLLPLLPLFPVLCVFENATRDSIPTTFCVHMHSQLTRLLLLLLLSLYRPNGRNDGRSFQTNSLPHLPNFMLLHCSCDPMNIWRH